MSRFVLALLILAALVAAGCSSEPKDSAPQSQAQGTDQTQPPQKIETPQSNLTPEQQRYATDIQMKPSGVRWQEMEVGTGNEVVQGSHVTFDYSCWIADPSGLVKAQGIGTSVGRPGQAYKCQVGVDPLPGLSDGLYGMKMGGSRRIFVPSSLGYPTGHPMAGNNLIFEAIGIKEITLEENQQFQDSVTFRLNLIRHIQDSIRRADSLAGKLDSLGNPIPVELEGNP